MKFLCFLVLIALAAELASSAPTPADGFVFPSDKRKDRKFESIITPPVLPILEHLERDPSTLLSNETGPAARRGGFNPSKGPVRPRFGGFERPKFGGGFSLTPSGNGGLTASVSQSASGGGASQAASQSFSFGFNEGFSGSHSASQSSSFSSGFGNGFSGSQASSQAASFSGGSVSAAASAASSHTAGGNSGSQSASSAFGFNSLNGFQPSLTEDNYGEGLLDVRHRGGHQSGGRQSGNHQSGGAFVFPGSSGRGVGVASTRVSKGNQRGHNDDWLAILVSD